MTPTPPPRRRGASTVVVLAVVLAALLTLWCVGTVLLIRYAPDLPDVQPQPTETLDR